MSFDISPGALLSLLTTHSRAATVVVDEDQQVLVASARWRALVPGVSDPLPGRRLHEVLPPVPAAALERLRAVCGGALQDTTVRLADPAGAPFWLRATAVLVPTASGALRVRVALVERLDETDWQRAHPDYATSLLNAALDSTADGVLIVDRRGGVMRANRRFCEMWQLPSDALAVRTDERLLEHVLPQLLDPDGFLTRVRELYAAPDRESADVVRLRDGRVFERYSRPQRVRGLVVGRVWSFRDVTARVRAERERDHLEAALRRHAKLESLATMAGGIAHDFNNLLLQVIGHGELLMNDLPARSPYRARVQQMHEAAARAAELTKRMLAYAGQVNATLEAVDLPALVRDTEADLRGTLPDTAALVVSCARAPRVRGDAGLLREALAMLVANALEAIGPGGRVRVRVEPVTVTDDELRACYFSALAAGPSVRLSVDDNGHGMDEGALARAFDPFFSTRFQGRGLGLPLVLGIVRAHQGAIALESAPAAGTTVRLWLPVDPEA